MKSEKKMSSKLVVLWIFIVGILVVLLFTAKDWIWGRVNYTGWSVTGGTKAI